MALPVAPLLQAGAGILQSIFGGGRERRALSQLERLETPQYAQNESIKDYYSKALNRYLTSPQDSALYKNQMKNINRGVATGIQGLQDRRSALAGIPNIINAQNDAMLNAEVAAEGQRDQRFNQLGGATEMKAGDDLRSFQFNKLAPYEKQYNLLAMKAGGGAQTLNSGLSNVFGGLQNWSNYDTLRQMYGSQNAGMPRTNNAYNAGSILGRASRN